GEQSHRVHPIVWKRKFPYLAVLFSWRGCPEMSYSSGVSNNLLVFSFRIGVPVCPLQFPQITFRNQVLL
ncbi:mCG1033799, partial [Mus musculus]